MEFQNLPYDLEIRFDLILLKVAIFMLGCPQISSEVANLAKKIRGAPPP